MYTNIYFDWKTKFVHLWDDKTGYSNFKYNSYCYKKTIKTDTEYHDIYGNNVERTSYDEKYYESDIQPELRVLVDRYHTEETTARNNVMRYDIEVDSEDGFGDALIGDKKIITISYNINLENKYTVLLLKNNTNPKFQRDDVELILFDTEVQLLDYWIQVLRDREITVISAWNGDGFDLPYIINRMKYIRYNYKKLSPIGIVDVDDHWGIKIAGLSHLDAMLIYKNPAFGNKKPSYSLNAVGEDELGLGKVEHIGLDRLFKDDIDEFIRYAVRDIEIMVGVEKKGRYLEIAMSVASENHIPYEWFHSSFKVTKGIIYTDCKLDKLCFVNIPRKDKQNFSGAFVLDPQTGLWKWIFDLDFASLYPNLDRTLNASLETKIGKILDFDDEVAEDWYKFREGDLQKNRDVTLLIDGNKKDIDFVKLDNMITENNCILACNGLIFDNEYEGLFPRIFAKRFAQRQEYRKLAKKYYEEGNMPMYEFYELKQKSKKISLNTIYGCFKFIDIDLAESITSTGRQLIQYSGRKVNSYIDGGKRNRLVYMHTDSLLFSLDGLEKDNDLQLLCDDIQKYSNDSIQEFTKLMLNVDNNYLELKKEILAETGLFIAKNRNAMKVVEENGKKMNKVDIKGINIISTSFPKAFKDILRTVLYAILDEKSEEEINSILIDFKKSLNKHSIYDLGIVKGVKNIEKWKEGKFGYIKGTPIQVKSALNYNNLLSNLGLTKKYQYVRSGDKLRYVYLKKNEYGFDTMSIPEETPKEIEKFITKNIDRESVFNGELKNKIMDFYEAMKWKYPDLNKISSGVFF